MAREKYVMSASLKEAADRDDRTTNQKSGFAEHFPRKWRTTAGSKCSCKHHEVKYLLFASFSDNDYCVLLSVEFWGKACGQFLAALYTFGFSFWPVALNVCSQRKLTRFLVFYKLNCLSLSFRDNYENLKLIYRLTRKKTSSVESMNQPPLFFIFFLSSCIFRCT